MIEVDKKPNCVSRRIHDLQAGDVFTVTNQVHDIFVVGDAGYIYKVTHMPRTFTKTDFVGKDLIVAKKAILTIKI